MDLFSFLTLALPALTPDRCNIHFATINDYGEDPLYEFENGTFEEWQSLQKRKVFNRPYVVSLIQTEDKMRWMYAGTYQTGEPPRFAQPVSGRQEAYFHYALRSVSALSEYAGRLHVSLAPAAKARNFVRRGESVAPSLEITDISRARRAFGCFPGYREVCIGMKTLGLIRRDNIQSWITALSVVKGIYLLTDEGGGKLYVGKADGCGGIWGRWMEYDRSGHGGNAGLIEAFGDLDAIRLEQVKFSVLEVMDFNSAEGEIDRREAHWKRVLLTRRYGHNRN